MTPAHAALLAAGWTLADAPELAGAHWRHPERGPFVWPEDRALALIAGQPGVGVARCLVCDELFPTASTAARYCSAACQSYVNEQRRRAAQPTRAEVAA